ncbi:MAG: AlpA family phage regulatory protein [Xanthobacteraceae bacterium]|jgi:prophage regulatory protein
MRLLSFAELQTEKGIKYSRQHIFRLVRSGRFPRPLKPSGSAKGVNAWSEAEIDAHIQARLAERDAGAPQTA